MLMNCVKDDLNMRSRARTSAWWKGVFCLLSIFLAGCSKGPTNSSPQIVFSRVPAADVGGPEITDTIEGRVSPVRADQRIVLYAKSEPSGVCVIARTGPPARLFSEFHCWCTYLDDMYLAGSAPASPRKQASFKRAGSHRDEIARPFMGSRQTSRSQFRFRAVEELPLSRRHRD